MSTAPEFSKYTDRDVRNDPSLMELAVAYAANYTGDFDPLVDAREMIEEENGLTVAVARKVLNCMRHDAKVATSLPKPKGGNVLPFIQPPPRRKSRDPKDKQCDNPKGHNWHVWGDDEYQYKYQCEGVPWEITRKAFRGVAKIKVAYAASRTGKLIHDVDPDGPHRTIWHGPMHAWGWRSDEQDWYDTDTDLIVKVICRFPSFIQKPILIKADELDQYMRIEDVRMGLREMEMCPHCAKVRANATPEPRKHFSECYMVQYPNDPDVHCTCLDWSPE